MRVFRIDPKGYNWKDDPVYILFNDHVLYTPMSFDKAVKVTQVDKWHWLSPDWRQATETEWNKQIAKWTEKNHSEARHILKRNTALFGFVGITFLFTSLPFFELDQTKGDITDFVACHINRCIYFETRCQISGYIFDIDDNFPEPPCLYDNMEEIESFEEWVSQLYNSSSWWLCFYVFERIYRSKESYICPQTPVEWMSVTESAD